MVAPPGEYSIKSNFSFAVHTQRLVGNVQAPSGRVELVDWERGEQVQVWQGYLDWEGAVFPLIQVRMLSFSSPRNLGVSGCSTRSSWETSGYDFQNAAAASSQIPRQCCQLLFS